MVVVPQSTVYRNEIEALDLLAGRVASGFAGLSLEDRLSAIRDLIPGRVVFTTSFGIEDQAISHALYSRALDIDVVTLDTGRLFPETYQVWSDTEARYGQRIRALVPDTDVLEALVAEQGIDGFRSSANARHACCNVRKVEPLGRAIAGASGWITGIRGDQSSGRSGMTPVSVDRERRLMKVSPLFDWSRDTVVTYVRDHRAPYNALHDRGFLSIGCAPCTRAVAPGEPERAGRWWWENDEKKECGLHNRQASAMAGRLPVSSTV
jgi:phosphoadenosine phosphosulfate reductase